MSDVQSTTASSARADRRPPSFTDQLIEPLSTLRSELDRFFDRFPSQLSGLRVGGIHALAAAPALELKENKRSYRVTAELPGMSADQIEVSLEDGLLRIAGEKQEERDEDERGYRVSERRYGAFERLIELPAAADDKNVTAKFAKGVLTVIVPKNGKAQQQPRRIAVEQS